MKTTNRKGKTQMTMMTSALPEVRHGLGAQYHNSVASKPVRPVQEECRSNSTSPEGKMFVSRGILLIAGS